MSLAKPVLLAKQLLPLLDLTSLNADDHAASITQLCQQAVTPYGAVAAVCIYPQWVGLAKKLLAGTSVKIATVANFPGGQASLAEVQTEIAQSVAAGADEIDVVAPYALYLAGQGEQVPAFLQAVRQVCGPSICLKVILETAALTDHSLIAVASRDAIQAGADFIKTSTGKHADGGASLPAAAVMLSTIQELNAATGFKAAGGIRQLDDAIAYLQLAELFLGSDHLNADRFRIGTSSLLTQLIDLIAKDH